MSCDRVCQSISAIIVPYVVFLDLALPGAYSDVICYDVHLHSCLWPITLECCVWPGLPHSLVSSWSFELLVLHSVSAPCFSTG